MKKLLLILLGLLALAASAHAQTLYWGGGTTTPVTSIDTTGATFSNFTGEWGASTTNWNASTSDSGNYTAWANNSIVGIKSSQNANAVSGATITLKSDFSVGGFNLSFPSSALNQPLNLVGDTGSVNRTVTLANDGVITVAGGSSNPFVFGNSGMVAGKGAVILAGTNLTFNGLSAAGAYNSGGGFLRIQSASTLGGTVKVNSGTVVMGYGIGTASLLNVTNFNILGNRAAFQIFQTGATDAVADTADIRLASGAFSLQATANATPANETVGRIILEGSGLINADTRGAQTSTAQSTLNLTSGFNRGDNGKGVFVANQGTGTDGGLGTSTGLLITGHGFGSSTSFIPYAVAQGKNYNVVTGTETGTAASTRFMGTDSSGKLGVINSTAGDATLANWSGTYNATTDIHFDTTTTGYLTGSLTGNTEIRSLAVGGNTATVVGTLGLGGNTLRANAIALDIAVAAGNTLTLGSAVNDGTLTANGTSGGDLYIIHQRSNELNSGGITVNSKFGDNGGAVNVIFGGQTASISVNGANTHTGKTYINGGKVTLGASASFLTTSEINIATGARLSVTGVTSGTNTTYGGGAIAQTIAGGGGPDALAGSETANIIADSRTITIGANGTIAPGDTGANENLSFSFTTGKLAFASGATVKLDLGAVASSDKISFTGTAGDWLSGSGNAILDVTSGDGFAYGVAYTTLYNVSTNGFAFGTVKLNGQTLGLSDYTWADEGTYYTISFAAIPEPSVYAMFAGLGILGFAALRRRRHV
ncbi:MAG: PEP-CTERM sorting domain-containing protein [Opitutaceae bacterium]|jgi:autotransporter-associated beta strand protein